MSTITTVTGRHFNPTAPNEQDIDIVDIAHALSLLCRGNGHTRRFYSVAQHSLACADEASARGATWVVTLGCLLHDASEAYLSDVTRPVKQELPQYRAAEERLQSAVWKRFIGRELTAEERRQIFDIDDCMLSMEFHQLLPEELNGDYRRLRTKVVCEARPPQDVAEAFLLYFLSHFDNFSVRTASGQDRQQALVCMPQLPAATPLWLLEREDAIAGCGYFDSAAHAPVCRYTSGENERLYHAFLQAAVLGQAAPGGRCCRDIRACGGKAVVLQTTDGELFYGIADHHSPDYCFHEFGVEEEAVQIGMYVFYKDDIQSVREWHVMQTLTGNSTNGEKNDN